MMVSYNFNCNYQTKNNYYLYILTLVVALEVVGKDILIISIAMSAMTYLSFVETRTTILSFTV